MNINKAEKIYNAYKRYKEAKKHLDHLQGNSKDKHLLFGVGFLEKAKEVYDESLAEVERL